MPETHYMVTMRGERVPYTVIRADDGRIVRTVMNVRRVGNVCACHTNPNTKCRVLGGPT